MRSPSLESSVVFDPLVTRIDGVYLPTISRTTGFNITELQPPTEIIDSESESSPAPRTCKNLFL